MKIEYAVIAQSHKVLPSGEIQFAGHLPSVAVLDEKHGFSLGNHKLYFAIAGEDIVAGSHTVRVVLRGPKGGEVILIDNLPGAAERDGIIFGKYNFGPEAGVALLGTYEFIFTLDGVEVGVQKFEVARVAGAAKANFLAYNQEKEGAAQGDTYVRGNLMFDVSTPDGPLGRFAVGIWQPQGLDLVEDELHLRLPSPSFDSPSFRAAVRKAHDHYLSMMIGGAKVSRLSQLTMESNILAGGFLTDFEFAEPASITASDAW
jgi:hypothetical protein